MHPKQTTLQALAMLRGNAGDNLARMEMQCREYTSEKMAAQFGYSGRTNAEMLADYQRAYDEALAAIAWVEAL